MGSELELMLSGIDADVCQPGNSSPSLRSTSPTVLREDPITVNCMDCSSTSETSLSNDHITFGRMHRSGIMSSPSANNGV